MITESQTFVVKLAFAVLFAGAGKAQAQNITSSEASGERVEMARILDAQEDLGVRYVYVKRPAAAAASPWRVWAQAPEAEKDVVVYSVNGEPVGSINANRARRGGWSGNLQVDVVYVSAPSVAGLDVKLAAWAETTVSTQTPVGVLNLAPVANRQLPLALKKFLPGIGRLAFLKKTLAQNTSGSEYYFCTAFVVNPGLALTAEHCVDGGLEDRYPELLLGYIGGDGHNTGSRHSVTLQEISKQLDLALLAFDPPVGSGSVLSIDSALPEVGRELLVLQHFLGDPLAISDDEDCLRLDSLFDGPSVWDRVHTKEDSVREAAFGHGCDSTSSSSGSPVLDRATYEVLGMHQQGYNDGSKPENRALRASLIVEFLKEKGVAK